MEILVPQRQSTIIYPSRYQRWVALAFYIILSPILLATDAFVIWAFWTHYKIDTGAYTVAFFALCETLLFGWLFWYLIHSRHRRRPDHPLIIINDQGIFTDFWPFRGDVFIPWEAILWIAARQVNPYTYLCICLKNTPRYWFFSGNRRPRTFKRDWATRAHINIRQIALHMSARHIIDTIQQNYAHQLTRHHIYLY